MVTARPHLLGHLLHIKIERSLDVAIRFHIVLTEPVLPLPLAVDGAQYLLGRGDNRARQKQNWRVHCYQIEHQGAGEDSGAAPRKVVQRRELVPHSAGRDTQGERERVLVQGETQGELVNGETGRQC